MGAIARYMMKKTYYLADEEGFLKSTLYLGDDEASRYVNLLNIAPPSRMPVTGMMPASLQFLKDAKWIKIKQARSAAEYGGFTWDGSTFDSDAISQTRIQGAVQLAGMSSEFSIDWTLADNSVRTLSAADMLAVGAALAAHVGVQFERARALRVQIEAAESPEALASLGW